MKVSTVEEMRELDRIAIGRYGIPGELLMENAGEAVYFVILMEIGVPGHRFLVLCGGGHNGGDGLVVARKLHSVGADVRVLLLGDPERFDDAPKLHLAMVQRAGIPLVLGPDVETIRTAVTGSDVVIDALLGTGIGREVRGAYREAIEAINGSGASVISIDIPSGVDGNTGQVWGAAVNSDLTVTFGLPKRGNLLYPGAEHCGTLYVSHISFPPELSSREEIVVEVSVPSPLPPRRPDGYKGTSSGALFIAGAAGRLGAAAFAAMAMLKAGGAPSRLAAPRSIAPHLAPLAAEVDYAPQAETAAGTLALTALDDLLELAAALRFVVVGPGLSLHPETQELIRRLLSRVDNPVLVDGDGLTAAAADPGVIRGRTQPTILTPHPGEMARLRGTSVAKVMEDPIAIVQHAARDLGAVVVLKGAHTVIGLPDGAVRINTNGSSTMTTVGSGDVLAGTIAAMYGLGLDLERAVQTGVFLHGLAGDLAAAEVGKDGVTARIILDFLPNSVTACRENHAELIADTCGAARVI